MRNQNALPAWAVIFLSLVVLSSAFMSYQPGADAAYQRGLFIFLFLIPIGIAIFFLSGIESLLVGLAVGGICTWTVIQPYYSAVPYSAWPQDKGLYAYIVYLANPLLTSGIASQLVAFLILSFWAGHLSAALKSKSSQTQGSVRATQDIYKRMESERLQFLAQSKKYDEDITRLGSLIITLSDLAKEIPSVLEVHGLLKLLMDKAMDLFSAKSCVIFHVDSASNRIIYACSIGYDEKMLMGLKLSADEESGIAGWCAKTGKFLSFREAQRDAHMIDLLRQNKFPIVFCQPIVQRGRSIAVLCVGDVKKEFQERELIRLASLLGNLSSIAIENAKLMEKTKEQAIRDGLTGLYNHRHFYDLLEDIMKKSRQRDALLGIFLIDIDHFKKFNDTHGHQVGDLILQETANIIQRQIQKNEIAARYGGEEFAVICMRKDTPAMKALAEDMRKAVEQAELQTGAMKFKITISIGAAFYDAEKEAGLSAGEFVKRSDDALYKAKESGRNRVIVHGQS